MAAIPQPRCRLPSCIRRQAPSWQNLAGTVTFPPIFLSQAKRNILNMNFSLKTVCQPDELNLDLSSAPWCLAWRLSTESRGFLPAKVPEDLCRSCAPCWKPHGPSDSTRGSPRWVGSSGGDHCLTAWMKHPYTSKTTAPKDLRKNRSLKSLSHLQICLAIQRIESLS